MPLRLLALLLVMAGSAVSGGALAEDAGRGTTQITANYGVYFVGLHFGDVRLIISVRNFGYEMKGDGRFSLLGGLIYEWRGATMSAGKLDKSGPKPSLYTLSYSGGNKEGHVRVAFAGGAMPFANSASLSFANASSSGVVGPERSRTASPSAARRSVCRPTSSGQGPRRLKVCGNRSHNNSMTAPICARLAVLLIWIGDH